MWNGTATITASDRRQRGPTLALLSWLIILCAASPTPARAADDPRATLLALQAADLRVATVAFRLASAGVAACPLVSPLSGVALHDASQYARRFRDAARVTLSLGERVGIIAVVPGSPAYAAGVLAGDGLIAIAGQPVRTTEPGRRTGDVHVAAVHTALEAAAARGPIALLVERGGRSIPLLMSSVAGCASRVRLRTGAAVHAGADGRTVSVTTGLLDYVANDDELAIVIAHEMAHNALGHRARLQAAGVRQGLFGGYGKGVAEVRATEAAADRLAYRLMRQAGYDLNRVEAFWRRLYAGPARGRANAATHGNLEERLTGLRDARVQTSLDEPTAGSVP